MPRGIYPKNKGKKLSEEHKRKISPLGRRHSEESKKKMSIVQKLIQPKGENHPNWSGGSVVSRERWNKKRAEYSAKQRDSFPEMVKWFGVKARAKTLNIPINISRKEFEEWFKAEPKTCSYCSRDISTRTNDRMNNSSVDRKYNSIGYVRGNLCLACNRCNTVKGNVFNYEQMKEIANKYLKITSA